MKKRIRRRPLDEIKAIVNKKMDDMQNTKKSELLKKIWETKPYAARGKE